VLQPRRTSKIAGRDLVHAVELGDIDEADPLEIDREHGGEGGQSRTMIERFA
jgi:hypothetical protein